jgi:hypothetical protein
MATLFGMFPFLQSSSLTAAIMDPNSTGLCTRAPAPESCDRQAFRSGQGIRGLAQTLGRRTHFRLAHSLSQACQGLGEPQSKSARIHAPRFNPPHAQKTL